MSRHLRQSGQLSRLLRASQKASLQRDACLISISRAAATPTLRTGRANQLRYYASDRPPKPSKGFKKPKGDAVDPASKHTDKSSPQKDNDSIERFPLPSGWVYLTDEEYMLLRAAFQLSGASKLPFGLSPVKTIHDAIDRARYTGVPIELRDLCYELKNRLPSISEMQSLALNFSKVWMRYNEMSDQDSTENSSQNKNDNKTNEVNGEESAQPFNGRGQHPNNQKKSGKRQQGQKQQGQGQQGQGKQGQGQQGQGQPGQGKPGQGQPGQGQPGQGGGMPATSISFLQAMGVLLFVFYMLNSSSSQQRQITWEEARTAYLDKGLVQKFVVIDGSKVRLVLRPDSGEIAGEEGPKLLSYTFSIGSVDTFERKLEQAQDELGIPSNQRIPVSYESGESTLGNVLYAFGPTLLFIGIIIYTQRKLGGRGGGSGMFTFGKSRAQRFNAENTVKVKFSDVAGLEEAKTEIMEFVSFLKQPEKFEKLGAKIPRGAILSGPPGTGKTLLAKATAGESGVPFFSVSGSEFVEMFVGVGPSRVRDLFSEGRKNAPCIIFIDEIDAIGRSRQNSGKGYGGNDEREATLNQILTEMDGFNTREQVVVLAGTNRADVLDSALMRPGRFDRHIYVDRPTMSGRKEIFRVYLAKIVTSENIDNLVGRLSTLTPGFSGADISNVVNEAALIAARSNATEVKMEHFESAIERVICGLERKSLVLNPEEKKTIAYHEAGHAICGWFLRYADPLLKVSIIPRGQGALGYAQYLPQDAYLMSTKQLMDRMAMTMGGRVSEELNFTTVTTGASDDFKKVSQMARNMVTQWGMSDVVGHVHFDNDPNQLQKPFAESTAQKIDDEVKRIVEEAHKRCKDLLTEKKKEVELIAEELLKKEVLVRDDMVRLLGERPFGDNAEFEKYFGGKEKSAPPPFPGEGGDGKGPAPGGDFPEPSPAFGRVSKEETSGMR